MESPVLTAQQETCLAYIAGRQREGVCPSYVEIATALQLSPKAKGRVSVILSQLIAKGRLRRMAHKARALEVVGGPLVEVRPLRPLRSPSPDAQFFVVATDKDGDGNAHLVEIQPALVEKPSPTRPS